MHVLKTVRPQSLRYIKNHYFVVYIGLLFNGIYILVTICVYQTIHVWAGPYTWLPIPDHSYITNYFYFVNLTVHMHMVGYTHMVANIFRVIFMVYIGLVFLYRYRAVHFLRQNHNFPQKYFRIC